MTKREHATALFVVAIYHWLMGEPEAELIIRAALDVAFHPRADA